LQAVLTRVAAKEAFVLALSKPVFDAALKKIVKKPPTPETKPKPVKADG
jgi:hypothetical protein